MVGLTDIYNIADFCYVLYTLTEFTFKILISVLMSFTFKNHTWLISVYNLDEM